MWARPDTGSSPTSYPIPTWSAVKGLFESIAFLKDGRAWVNPTHVEVCKPVNQQSHGEIHYQKYMTNYGGPLRETTLVNNGNNYQFPALMVANPCYRLYAKIENGSGKPMKRGDNPCHTLQGIFERRLHKGQCYHTPCLGWSECVPGYWGEFREGTEVDKKININLVSVLKGMFDSPLNGQYAPHFQQGEDAWIKEGEFRYAE